MSGRRSKAIRKRIYGDNDARTEYRFLYLYKQAKRRWKREGK